MRKMHIRCCRRYSISIHQIRLDFSKYSKKALNAQLPILKILGRARGKEFQRLSKACPAFAAEFAAVGLRHIRKHWGPINRKEAQIRPESDAMLRRVQAAVDGTPDV
jgi:hypothetical protein